MIIKKIKNLDDLIAKNTKKNIAVESNIIASPTQIQIMDYMLNHQNETVYQKDLENTTHLSRATISSVLQTMEKHGLVTRITDNIDTRTKIVRLNSETKNFFRENKNKFDNIEKQILSGISEDELNYFTRILDKMIKNIED